MGCGRLLIVEPNSITGRTDEVISLTEFATYLRKSPISFCSGQLLKGWP